MEIDVSKEERHAFSLDDESPHFAIFLDKIPEKNKNATPKGRMKGPIKMNEIEYLVLKTGTWDESNFKEIAVNRFAPPPFESSRWWSIAIRIMTVVGIQPLTR